MNVTLQDMQVRLKGKEERRLMSQFKVITNKELPKVSDPSKSYNGKYKKEKNETKFKWNFIDDSEGPKNKRDGTNDLDIMNFDA